MTVVECWNASKPKLPCPDIALDVPSGPFVAMQAVLPPKPIQVKPGSASASASAAATAAPAAAGGSGQYPPATPLQTPPYSALRTPRTPALLDAFGKGDSTITHFAPPDSKGIADHTLKTLGLAFNMYETYLGCKFPYKALQTVSCYPDVFLVATRACCPVCMPAFLLQESQVARRQHT